MMDFVRIVLGLLVVGGAFGFIIFIHEMGHFLIARYVGIRCPEFAIGFGPALFAFRFRGTRFGLRLFPLGGYVLMVGEDPNADQADSWHEKVSTVLHGVTYPTTPRAILADPPAPLPATEEGPLLTPEDREEVLEHLRLLPPEESFASQEALEGNFNHKTFPQRIAVILGGVTMNFIAATLLMWGLGFTVGLGAIQQDSVALLSSVEKGSAAERAGMKPGDLVEEVAGQPILSGPAMIHALSACPGRTIDIAVKRQGQLQTLKVTPDIRVGPLFISATGQEARLVYMPEGYQGEYKKLGANVGDVIIGAGTTPVTTPESLVEAVRSALPPSSASGAEKRVKLQLLRRDQSPLELEYTPTELKPVGKIGVGLSQVTSIGFRRATTNLVQAVAPGSLAEQMGFKPQDELVDIDGSNIFDADSLQSALPRIASSWSSRDPGARSVTIGVYRGEERLNLLLKTAPPPELEAFGLQLQPIDAAMILKAPLIWIGRFTIAPVSIGVGLAKGLLKWEPLKKSSAGPLGMMRMIYQISGNGLAIILFFLAILNAAVGSFNLIPFPALDGSRCLILLVGWIRGKSFDPNKEAVIHLAGLCVLLLLVVSLSVQDIANWWSGTPLMK